MGPAPATKGVHPGFDGYDRHLPLPSSPLVGGETADGQSCPGSAALPLGPQSPARRRYSRFKTGCGLLWWSPHATSRQRLRI